MEVIEFCIRLNFRRTRSDVELQELVDKLLRRQGNAS
jgi:hypothetical protein